MNASTKSAVKPRLGGVAGLFFAAAGLSFLGGSAISEFADIDRALAEVEGFGVAAP